MKKSPVALFQSLKGIKIKTTRSDNPDCGPKNLSPLCQCQCRR